MVTGKNSFRIDFDFSSFEKKLDTLIATDPAESIMRKAAGAGAKILYEEMKTRVPVKTGKLKESIYYWWDKQQSGKQSALYRIGPNTKKAPHWHLVEFGHWDKAKKHFTPAHSYMRTTFDARSKQALSVSKNKLNELIGEIFNGKGTG